ncbi:hypothetical protein JRO89_XS05G0192700 [Xanthoceras sorbifolium]|uniref:NADP-dependent oxidoreductase domain-containing protein n=1 Tax=Xanthoceras sorbifolium TaxID=99658 RepID=A0ABQ8I2F5_9ROSI|nr:hypothetical protein JRO89_XS05G0192700 [Xanthoceras sorbifolium]
MPVIGMGTASSNEVGAETTKAAIVDAIKAGYRHFDTALIYGSEQPVGQAIAEALHTGVIKSRDELFITSKLWCTFADKHLVLPAIKMSLRFRNLQLDYLDLFLIHWPLKLSQEISQIPVPKEHIFPIDIKSVWEAMEETQVLGLTKAVGVCNFSSKRLGEILSFAKIPPAINQVEMNPLWQQKALRAFCKSKNIVVMAYSPLGKGGNQILDCDLLKEIAQSKEKTTAQVALRWVYEQGVSLVTKSFNKDRMKENLDIFDWSLSKEELNKIDQLPQRKGLFLNTFMEPHDLVLEIDSEI